MEEQMILHEDSGSGKGFEVFTYFLLLRRCPSSYTPLLVPRIILETPRENAIITIA